MRSRMARFEFHKMHGLGNDFVVIDARTAAAEMSATRAAALANRRTGIGCDQLILLSASDKADIKMRIFNADGGEVEACGNASRCVVKLLGQDIRIETSGGTISGEMSGEHIRMDMGTPRFEWQQIPLAYAMDTAAMPVAWDELKNPAAVNVGNPHAIFVVSDSAAVDLARLGPVIENDQLFPDRVNVNVASVADGAVNLRVWERGVGETQACGTGACATAVALIQKKLVESPVIVKLTGGSLAIEWREGGSITMTGPAMHVFTGSADWADFPL